MHGFLVGYDRRWPAAFEAERAKLADVLGPWGAGGIHHIGSTAIPGMPAKPILDMIAGVRRLSDADDAAGVLHALGYEGRPHRVDGVLFIARDAGRDRRHLHLTIPGSDLWCERLAFRDALRARPELAAAYRDLKQRLLSDSGGDGYDSADKREFVRAVLASAGLTLRDGLHDRPRS